MSTTEEEGAGDVQMEPLRLDESSSSLSDMEDALLSLETLDRASPELWPEKIPGVLEFVSSCGDSRNGDKVSQPWLGVLDKEDHMLMHQFGSLTPSGLMEEIKRLHNIAYQLGLEEAKEMTRGKYLEVLKRKKR